MSQQKAQLINATENVSLSGGLDVSGVTTAGNFIGSFSGTATGLSGTPNITLGIVTATTYSGDGSNLTGVGSSAFIGVVTAAQSGTTTIDLSLGNTIYFTQDTDTTVAFANTEAVQKLKFIRVKDDTTTPRSITWPSSIIWNGGTAPTLIDSSSSEDVQIFNLTTRDQGVTWYGYEAMKNDPAEPVASYEVWVFGQNSYGGLGLNDTVNYSSPTQIPGTQWSFIAYSQNHGLATKKDGTLWSWGYNARGQVGSNNTIEYSSPIQIPGTQWRDVSSGKAGYSVASKTDGTLWSWGRNDYGNLGLTTPVGGGQAVSSPTQIPGTQWSGVAANSYVTRASKTDGTLWVWGFNLSPRLGLNDTVNRSSPTQIPGTQWASIGESMSSSSYGGDIHGALKTDGTLWVWGANTYSLGLNDTIARSSPIQLPGTQWSYISTGANHMVASKTDGTLWAWGYGLQGQLGQNSTSYISSPRQIPGTQWAYSKHTLSTGRQHSTSAKTDGTMWTWGKNNHGQLGQNDTIARSSPIQIPGTLWSKVSSGTYINAGLKTP